jgi:small conductance mechanosensitive channel
MILSWSAVVDAFGRLPPWLRLSAMIVSPFVVAWIVARLAAPLSRRIVRLAGWARRAPGRPARRATIEGLVRDLIRVTAFTAAAMVALAQSDLVDARTLVWGIGLLSAGIGLGARPVISDYFIGLTFIFGDRFTVGEKVSLLGAAPGEVEGIVERVNLSTLHLRAPSGELLVVPNGEVRVVRNFSRGLFSSASVRIRVKAADLGRTLLALEAMRGEAMSALPDLIEPWQVISEDGLIGHETQLLVVAKARFGAAAGVRPRLLAFLHERLADADVTLAD